MRRAGCAALAAILLMGAAPMPTPDDRANIHWVAQETEIAADLDALSARAVHEFIVFRDVSVVDVVAARSIAHRSVFVRDGKIAWVGDTAVAPDTTGATIVDGRGLYLSPGLTDMHVHTQSLAEQLLRMANGQTGARDMDGFPWMLELRRAITSGALLAPHEYIAGTIITNRPMGGYSVVVHSPEEAREVVRKQAACGYDFIKVHNLLGLDNFDAIADETHRAGMDLVGHIPHDITIDHAVHSGGMRTLEHLKGFILDETLTTNDEDYGKAMAGADVWITPTFYTALRGEGQEDAANRINLPEKKYAALRERQTWTNPPDEHAIKVTALYRTALPATMKKLVPLHPHWLAGTDSASYPLQVAGFALLDELNLMEQFGIARDDVLRAATSEPAAAMRHADFGRIATGLRADLVLLTTDPTKDLNAYRDNRGVVLGGRWLARAPLDEAMARLAQIEAEPDDGYTISIRSAKDLAAHVTALAARHIVFDDRHVGPAVESLRKLGHSATADALEATEDQLKNGPCAEITPSE
jgi:cytosine/adenosine deaminase-related metal-dependent hydrolase